jgi:hypothetical protein
LGSFIHVNGQKIVQNDTLIPFQKRNTLPNRTFIVDRDTLVFLLDTVTEKKNRNDSTNGGKFYNSLKQGANKRKFTKELYNLIFVSPDKLNPTDTIKTERSETAFLQYHGKTIRQISIHVLEPFGPTLYDTTQVSTTWLENTGNKLHHSSRTKYIKKLLRIKEGDSLDPFNLADNERLIRELSYIKDAYFRVIPVPGSSTLVDLQLWIKDQFSWGANMSIGSLISTDFEIYSRNLYGLGHELSNRFEIDGAEDQKYGYTGMYKIRNIQKSYVDATFTYQNTEEKARYGIDLEREFATYNTKYAGGINLLRTIRSYEITSNDPITNDTILKFNYGNIWYGRSYKVKSSKTFARRKLYLAARMLNLHFFERPDVTAETNQFYRNRTLFLTSLSLSETQYYKSNLIYNFGRTEDIPYGFLAQVNMGFEYGEYYNRNYLSLDFQRATYFKKSKSYFFSRASIGGYFNAKRFEQGVLQIQTKFFSRIRKIGKYRFRNFGDLQYTLGIRRFSNEFISLEDGIRGFSEEVATGTQRLVLNLESIAFTPYTLGGFRFAFYTFTDMGFIGSNKKNILKQDFYYGLGLGIRLHNENLVFKTIQIRLAFYPNIPSAYDQFNYRLSGSERPEFNSFKVTQPNVLFFE